MLQMFVKYFFDLDIQQRQKAIHLPSACCFLPTTGGFALLIASFENSVGEFGCLGNELINANVPVKQVIQLIAHP